MLLWLFWYYGYVLPEKIPKFNFNSFEVKLQTCCALSLQSLLNRDYFVLVGKLYHVVPSFAYTSFLLFLIFSSKIKRENFGFSFSCYVLVWVTRSCCATRACVSCFGCGTDIMSYSVTNRLKCETEKSNNFTTVTVTL